MRLLAILVVALTVPAVADPATGRSPSACAVAWNRSAGAQLHAAVKRSGAVAAYIDARAAVGRDTWRKKGGSTSTTAPGCGISFVLPSGSLLLTGGAWVGDTVPRWQRLVPSIRRVVVPHNARVRADGTVGFHG